MCALCNLIRMRKTNEFLLLFRCQALEGMSGILVFTFLHAFLRAVVENYSL